MRGEGRTEGDERGMEEGRRERERIKERKEGSSQMVLWGSPDLIRGLPCRGEWKGEAVHVEVLGAGGDV